MGKLSPIEWAVQRFAKDLYEEIENHKSDDAAYWGNFQSPLEEAFYEWWYVVREVETRVYTFFDRIGLIPQKEITCAGKKYRLDFMLDFHGQTDASRYSLTANGHPALNVGVELDGHEFHERTKEQVALRDRRDRALQKAGWKIFHYSGSEFYRNPVRCVSEVYEYADDTLRVVLREAYEQQQRLRA